MKIQNNKGKFRVQYYLYTEKNGKRHYGSKTFDSEFDAEVFREQVYAERKQRKSIEKQYNVSYGTLLANATAQSKSKHKKQGKYSILTRDKIGEIKKDLPKSIKQELRKIDKMTGVEFEQYTISLLRLSGMFYGGEIVGTNIVNDFGVDIVLTTSNGIRVVIQCKRMEGKVRMDSVQEVYSGMPSYKAQFGAVITNNYFAPATIKLAKSNNIFLIDRDGLSLLIKREMEFTNNLIYGNQWADLVSYIESSKPSDIEESNLG